MIVYVESNFVLELALQQEQCESCRKILEAGKKGICRLVLPTFCISEPYDTIIRNSKNRTSLKNNLETEINQISRSKPYQQIVAALRDVTSLLVRPNEEDRDNLYLTLEDVLSVAETVGINSEIIHTASESRKRLNLQPHDSVVYASVLFHLKAAGFEDKCFLTRDTHFKSSDINAEMETFNCRVYTDFGEGYEFIHRH